MTGMLSVRRVQPDAFVSSMLRTWDNDRNVVDQRVGTKVQEVEVEVEVANEETLSFQ